MSNTIPPMVRSARGKRPNFYETKGLDEVMSMVLVLAGEVSVLGDQIDLIQRVAKQKGIDLAEGMAAYQFSQEELEEREARRQEMLGRLFYLMKKEASEAEGEETTDGYDAVISETAKA